MIVPAQGNERAQAPIDLPIKIKLTNEAVARFRAQNRKLVRLQMADDTAAYGLTGSRCELAVLDRLMDSGLLAGIESTGTDLFDRRQDLLALTSTVTRNILNERFAREFRARVLATDAVRQWNRHHPHRIIDDETRISEASARAFTKQHAAQVRQLRQSIMGPVTQAISGDARLSEDDKQARIVLGSDYLNHVEPSTWYVALLLCTGEGRTELETHGRELLRRYVDKSTIADYIGLIVVELVGYLQNSMLVRAAKAHRKDVTFDTLIRDGILLSTVREEVKSGEELQAVTWEVGARKSTFERRTRFVISIYSHGEADQRTWADINEHKNASLHESSLKKFLQATADGTVNSDLGLYYLADLTRSCNELGILFDSSAVQAGSGSRERITLNFHF